MEPTGSGLSWKKNEEETLDRLRRFLRREMQDGILAVLPVSTETPEEWRAFKEKWHWERYREAEERPFPCNEEIHDRSLIGLQRRCQVEDDWLPVLYSVLDIGDDSGRGLFGKPLRFFHRDGGAAYSGGEPILKDYAHLDEVRFSLSSPWPRRIMDIIGYFEQRARGRFAQHPQLTIDGMNFAMMARGLAEAYVDLYEHPRELRQIMEIGLDFAVRYTDAQQRIIPPYRDGSFVWLTGWAPFDHAIAMSVDAYVLCSPRTYVEFGLEYQTRLLQHFGHGLMHFHDNHPDLAAEVAKLPNLALFQYGAGLPNGPPDYTFLPQIRKAVGDIPIMVYYPMNEFRDGLARHRLLPNVIYHVHGSPMSIDEANRMMEQVRAYRT